MVVEVEFWQLVQRLISLGGTELHAGVALEGQVALLVEDALSGLAATSATSEEALVHVLGGEASVLVSRELRLRKALVRDRVAGVASSSLELLLVVLLDLRACKYFLPLIGFGFVGPLDGPDGGGEDGFDPAHLPLLLLVLPAQSKVAQVQASHQLGV